VLKIQEFISYFSSISEASTYLKRNLGIDCSAELDESHRAMFLLKPGHISDMTNPLVREANCLMLYADGEIMAKSYDHPYVVKTADKIPSYFDITGAICEEVPDGIDIVIYNVDGEWRIGTRDSIYGKTPSLSKNVPGSTVEHEVKRFLAIKSKPWAKSFENVNPFLCFTCNFVTSSSNNVMPILTSSLLLTGIMNSETGKEMSAAMVEAMSESLNIIRPPRSTLNGSVSLANRLFNMRALCPGLMLRDKNDNRLFVPNPIYAAVKNAKDAGTLLRPTHIAKILKACRDKADAVTIMTSYDNFRPMLDLLRSVRGELIQELIMLWAVAKKEEDLKDFAGMVQHHPLNYVLFKLRNNEATDLQHEVEHLKSHKLVNLAKEKWEKEFDAASRSLKTTGG